MISHHRYTTLRKDSGKDYCLFTRYCIACEFRLHVRHLLLHSREQMLKLKTAPRAHNVWRNVPRGGRCYL